MLGAGAAASPRPAGRCVRPDARRRALRLGRIPRAAPQRDRAACSRSCRWRSSSLTRCPAGRRGRRLGADQHQPADRRLHRAGRRDHRAHATEPPPTTPIATRFLASGPALFAAGFPGRVLRADRPGASRARRSRPPSSSQPKAAPSEAGLGGVTSRSGGGGWRISRTSGRASAGSYRDVRLLEEGPPSGQPSGMPKMATGHVLAPRPFVVLAMAPNVPSRCRTSRSKEDM